MAACPACDTTLVVEAYRCPSCGTEVRGRFQGCPFCRLGDEERYFALVFLQCEGSLKDVERVMGISYPTVKARLAEVRLKLGGGPAPSPERPRAAEAAGGGASHEEVLAAMERGEIDFHEAMKRLKEKP